MMGAEAPRGAWALVPVKRFDRGKSRLGEALSALEREGLARAMFDRVVGEVLRGLVEEGDLAGVLVITDGEEVAARARDHGAYAMISEGVRPGRQLGAIVDEGLAELGKCSVRTASPTDDCARRTKKARGAPYEEGAPHAKAGLVIMGDLPSLEAEDVRSLAAMLESHDVVLAPDAAGTGTNALAVRLPAPMPTRFCGGESLADHVEDARRLGLRVAICERPGFGFDVDKPGDYERLRARHPLGEGVPTMHALDFKGERAG